MHFVDLVAGLRAPLRRQLLDAVLQQKVAHSIILMTLNLDRDLVLAPERLMGQVPGELEELGVFEPQVLDGDDAMEGADLVVDDFAEACHVLAIFVVFCRFAALARLLLLDCVDDLLGHASNLRVEDRLEAPHKRLEERVVEDFLAQVEQVLEHFLGPFDVCSRIFARLAPLLLVLQRDQLQNDLNFGCIESL